MFVVSTDCEGSGFITDILVACFITHRFGGFMRIICLWISYPDSSWAGTLIKRDLKNKESSVNWRKNWSISYRIHLRSTFCPAVLNDPDEKLIVNSDGLSKLLWNCGGGSSWIFGFHHDRPKKGTAQTFLTTENFIFGWYNIRRTSQFGNCECLFSSVQRNKGKCNLENILWSNSKLSNIFWDRCKHVDLTKAYLLDRKV